MIKKRRWGEKNKAFRQRNEALKKAKQNAKRPCTTSLAYGLFTFQPIAATSLADKVFLLLRTNQTVCQICESRLNHLPLKICMHLVVARL